MSFTVGQQVGPYKIIGELGKGGMATVYKAHHDILDRDVAIKVMHIVYKDDETFLERFRREAQIVGRLEHPNIVPIFDFSDIDDQPYLVMKHVEGRTLKQRIRKSPPLSLDDTLRIMTAVASALDYAHKQGILHRDVKPSNIIIDKDDHPYLTDFGLARIASLGESTLSRDMMLGTPQYISPEQAQGNRELNNRTDIYSLGIILYELVVGRVPFTGDTPYSIIHNHIFTPLPSPTEVNPTVPAGVEAVLLKALAKNPDDRYPTAMAMIKDFEQAVKRENMQELSAASFRPEAFARHAERSMQQPSIQSPQYGAPPPMGMPDNTGGSWVPHTASQDRSIRKKGAVRHWNIWAVGGCLIFICGCFGVFSTLARASDIADSMVVDPVFGDSNSVDDSLPANDESHFETLEEFMADGLAVAKAEAYIQEYPDDALGYFALALAKLEERQFAQATTALSNGFAKTEPDGILVAEMASVLRERGYTEPAVRLYLSIFEADSTNERAREVGGQYLYELASDGTTESWQLFCEVADDYSSSIYLGALLGQAVISSGTDLENPEWPMGCDVSVQQPVVELISLELAATETPPEIDFIQGNFYAATGRRIRAIGQWRLAYSDSTTPDWLREELRVTLAEDQ